MYLNILQYSVVSRITKKTVHCGDHSVNPLMTSNVNIPCAFRAYLIFHDKDDKLKIKGEEQKYLSQEFHPLGFCYRLSHHCM